MPFLLYRYLLTDLLRSIGLTTVVLVSVVAFGAAIRPLANEQLLGPAQAIKYVFLAMVPMLQFALPFSAGFGATLTMHRLAVENEIVAMAAGGLSYRRIIFPVILLGVLLTGMMVGLTQWVIPRFWGIMEQSITSDVTEILASRIRNQRPFMFGSVQMFADRIIPQDHATDTGADQRLVMFGVAAIETDDEGNVVMDVTAKQATIDVYRRNGQTILKLIMTDTVAYRADTREMMRSPLIEPPAVMVPSVRRSQPRAMTRDDLLALRETPEVFSPVASALQRLDEAIADHVLWSWLNEQLQRDGQVMLTDAAHVDRTYLVLGTSVEGGVLHTIGGGAIRITRLSSGTPDRRFTATEVRLDRARAGSLAGGAFSLHLRGVTVEDLAGARGENDREALVIDTAAPEGLSSPGISAPTVADSLSRVTGLRGINPELEVTAARLELELRKMNLEAEGRLAKRYAMSVTSLLLLVLGAVLAMWLRYAQPLTIYLLAFLPSILDILLISSGREMMRDGQLEWGLATMWSGNAVMLLVIGLAYRSMSRN